MKKKITIKRSDYTVGKHSIKPKSKPGRSAAKKTLSVGSPLKKEKSRERKSA